MSIEDLTTYNETDPDGVISKTSSRVTLNGLYGDQDAYVYKDFGVAHFNDIDLLFTFSIKSSTIDWGACDLGFANTVNDSYNWTGHNICVALTRNDDTGKYYCSIYDGSYSDDSCVVSSNTVYYCRLIRVAGSGTANLYIYTDSARTSLHDTLTITTLSTTTFRYLYAACSYNYGGWESRFYGYTENFEFITASKIPVIVHHLRQQGIM